MPTSVAELFASAGLVRLATVRWNTPIQESRPGVYIISLSDSPDKVSSTLPYPPLHRAVFEEWLHICSALTLNGTKPTIDHLMERIGHFWLPDEAVLYIGLATSLSERIRQYYKTPIGAKRPHSCGYFLKLLVNLPELWVHYATADHPETAESKMLQRFTMGASEATRKILLDPSHPFPFANLEWPRGIRKAHGILGARAASE